MRLPSEKIKVAGRDKKNAYDNWATMENRRRIKERY
jgi:hypothetical protein